MDIDKEWFPNQYSNDVDIGQLYVRMCHLSMDESLAVAKPNYTKLFAFLSPTLMKQKNLKLQCSTGFNKTWPLGHGQYSLGGNLGPVAPYVRNAKMNGFDDVLWLLDDYVQEMTILNVFFVIKNDSDGSIELITPPNNGCIVAGVPRNSILDLASQIKDKTGMHVVERPITIHELI